MNDIQSEEQEYMTLDEAAQSLGTKKGSLYYYLRVLAVSPRKFPLNRHAFIHKADVERIRAAKSSPWKIVQGDSTTVPSVPNEQAKNGEKSASMRPIDG